MSLASIKDLSFVLSVLVFAAIAFARLIILIRKRYGVAGKPLPAEWSVAQKQQYGWLNTLGGAGMVALWTLLIERGLLLAPLAQGDRHAFWALVFALFYTTIWLNFVAADPPVSVVSDRAFAAYFWTSLAMRLLFFGPLFLLTLVMIFNW